MHNTYTISHHGFFGLMGSVVVLIGIHRRQPDQRVDKSVKHRQPKALSASLEWLNHLPLEFSYAATGVRSPDR
jgi:hypothetical protein